MEDRIEIPTSEPDASPGRSPSRRWWALVVLALASVGVAAVFTDGGGSESIEGDGEIAPPPTVEGGNTRPALNSFRLPGTGTVTSIIEIDGELVAIVAGDFWGSSVWRLDGASGTWTVTEGVPGVTIVDAAVHPEGLAAVGFGTFDRIPVLLLGPLTDLQPFPLDLDVGQVPGDVDVVSGSLFVTAGFGDGTNRGPTTTYLIDDRRGARPLGPTAGGAVIEDLFSDDSQVFAVGSDAGRPAMWLVGADGSLDRTDLDVGLESGRLAAAGRVDDELVGLVISGFGTELASTSVYRLEPPYTVLDEPIPGAWDRLVAGGDELLALPEEFLALPDGTLTTYRTSSGISWVAGRTRFVPPGDGDRGERTMLIQTAVFRESGDLVVAGTASGQWRFPVAASEGDVGTSSEILSDPWSAVEQVESGRRVVHVGGIQVSLFEDVVTVRDGVDRPWSQPVFADESSVGGVVEVVELDFGYLLSATRPYRALWFSTDGRAWQLVERDVIDVAGSGDAAIAIVNRDGDLEVVTIDRSGRTARSDREPPYGERLGYVPGFGYVTGPVNGVVYTSASGSEWTELEVASVVDDLQFGDDSIALRTASGWSRYSEPGPVRSIDRPDGNAVLGSNAFLVDGGLAVLDRGLFVTSDFVGWTEVPFGIWGGADGPVSYLDVDREQVVGQLGGETESTLLLFER